MNSNSETLLLILMLTFIFIVNIKCMGAVLNYNKLINTTDFKLNNKIIRNFNEYEKLRQHLYDKDLVYDFQNDIILNEREKIVNEIIMKLKLKEINEGFQNPYNFTPSTNFLKFIEKIKKSKLFQIIKLMPKGGILHVHSMAMCSPDYIISLTYREHLWQCNKIDDTNVTFTFKYSLTKPIVMTNNCQWHKVSEIRSKIGNTTYDNKLKKLFSIYGNKYSSTSSSSHEDINAAWSKFSKIHKLYKSIVTYAPNWKDYYKNALKEMYADGVQYLEFRSSLQPVYDLNGNIYSPNDVVQLYKDGLDEFMAENPNFIGSKFIYARKRNVNDTKFNDYLVTVKELHSKFPTFMAGFDLVGQEDLGRPLIDFVPKLLELPTDIKFFFHAGETNWFGTSSDENLIDAILLGSQRIGHGYALIKHPALIDLIKEKDIAIEINPISNQVLKLVDDLRNHPASYFFANNLPIVISSDDPSIWNATPLSHDFYEAFLGITSKHSDLRTLKKLAMNSIKYSSLNEWEKLIAFNKWQLKWNEFIDKLINNYQ